MARREPDPLHPGGEDPGVVALVGDIHGCLPWMRQVIEHVNEAGVRVIVQLGDFGFWADVPSTRKFLSRTTRDLDDRRMFLCWLPGNHESYARIAELPRDEQTGLAMVTRHIHMLPRPHRWTWHGRTYLALGGAVSVDRQHRHAGRDWWPEEELTRDEVAAAIAPGGVDVLLTHDAPDRVVIPGLAGTSIWPADLIRRSEQHRGLVGEVLRATRPTLAVHGHMHVRYTAAYEHIDGAQTKVEGLSCDNGALADNVLFLDTHALEVTPAARFRP